MEKTSLQICLGRWANFKINSALSVAFKRRNWLPSILHMASMRSFLSSFKAWQCSKKCSSFSISAEHSLHSLCWRGHAAHPKRPVSTSNGRHPILSAAITLLQSAGIGPVTYGSAVGRGLISL